MDYLRVVKNVLNIEAKALLSASEKLNNAEIARIGEKFEYISRVGGGLIFCGVGKSGDIAIKLASTFTSLGLPSFFLHPVEALHGDLGRVRGNDLVVFISNSGTTEEIIKLIPFLPVDKSMRIGLLGNKNALIAKECDVVIDCSVEREACINNQAPTTSTTLALAMGDALAVLYESIVGLSKEGFAFNHPGGLLGKALRLKVKDLMLDKQKCPVLHESSTLQDAILKMTHMPVGGCAIVDSKGLLVGIIVEGDIRRTFAKDGKGLNTQIVEIMTRKPVCSFSDDLAYDALKLMEDREKQIGILPVVDANNTFLGLVRLHDLLKEGFKSKKEQIKEKPLESFLS